MKPVTDNDLLISLISISFMVIVASASLIIESIWR